MPDVGQEIEAQSKPRTHRRLALEVIGGAGAVLVLAGGITGWLSIRQPSLTSPQTRVLVPARTLKGHRKRVERAAWAPDDTLIASVDAEGMLYVWEANTGHILVSHHYGPQNQETHMLHTVAWSPDGNAIASGGRDQTVQVWQAPQGNVVRIFRRHHGETNALTWSPDGNSIASGGEDDLVQVWSVRTGNILGVCSRPHTGKGAEIGSLAWSHQGKQLVGACKDKYIYIWNLP